MLRRQGRRGGDECNYRKIYNLPETIQAGSTLEEILQHRTESGLFSG